MSDTTPQQNTNLTGGATLPVDLSPPPLAENANLSDGNAGSLIVNEANGDALRGAVGASATGNVPSDPTSSAYWARSGAGATPVAVLVAGSAPIASPRPTRQQLAAAAAGGGGFPKPPHPALFPFPVAHTALVSYSGEYSQPLIVSESDAVAALDSTSFVTAASTRANSLRRHDSHRAPPPDRLVLPETAFSSFDAALKHITPTTSVSSTNDPVVPPTST